MYTYNEYYYNSIVRKFYELEDHDRDAILEYLKENYPECWYEPEEYPFPERVTVVIPDNEGTDREVTILVSEWLWKT